LALARWEVSAQTTCIDLALIKKIILNDNMRMPVSRFRTSWRSKANPEDISLFNRMLKTAHLLCSPHPRPVR
jgi:hypothetical protein